MLIHPESFLGMLLGNPLFVLFAAIAAGLAIGNIRIKGVSLGTSGVIFSALALGAIGCELPSGIGTVGLVLFVYCVGLAAGPTFFRVFARQGSTFAKLGALLISLGAATAILFAWLFKIPTELAAGIFAGSMTSTPALAAALEFSQDASAVSIGYGIAYPLGVIAVILMVQLLPRLLRTDLTEVARRQGSTDDGQTLSRMLVEVLNPVVCGKSVAKVDFIAAECCQITRVLAGERLAPITSEMIFTAGQHLLVVGQRDNLVHVAEFLGQRSDRHYFMDTESERDRIVATSSQITGKTLAELGVRRNYGVTIAQITRHDIDFVPRATTEIQHTDVLLTIGEPQQLKKFAEFAGHRSRVLDETDMIYLAVGITLGVVLGLFPIVVPGIAPFTLGLAGGPLLVALAVGHYGRIGRIRGHIPRAARNLLQSIGLIFFLASAGVSAGGQLLSVLQEHGGGLIAMAVAVTVVPLAGGYLFASRFLKLNLLEILGSICGGMTSTPGLGAVASRTESDIPAISYAAVYPVALILVTLVVQVVIAALRWLGG